MGAGRRTIECGPRRPLDSVGVGVLDCRGRVSRRRRDDVRQRPVAGRGEQRHSRARTRFEFNTGKRMRQSHKTLALWVLLILMFWAIYQIISQDHPPKDSPEFSKFL